MLLIRSHPAPFQAQQGSPAHMIAPSSPLLCKLTNLLTHTQPVHNDLPPHGQLRSNWQPRSNQHQQLTGWKPPAAPTPPLNHRDAQLPQLPHFPPHGCQAILVTRGAVGRQEEEVVEVVVKDLPTTHARVTLWCFEMHYGGDVHSGGCGQIGCSHRAGTHAVQRARGGEGGATQKCTNAT